VSDGPWTIERIFNLGGSAAGVIALLFLLWDRWVVPGARWVFKSLSSLVRRKGAARLALRRKYRLWQLRRGKYVPNISIAEWKAVLQKPGIAGVHPQVRAETQQTFRAFEDRARESWIPPTHDWLRRR
jgi:hypothetical protein